MKNFPIAAAVVFVVLAGCARDMPTKQIWQNPDVPEAQWSQDTGECRRYARREVEREARLQDEPVSGSTLGGGLNTYQSSMSRYELERLQQRTFADCMRRRGYRPAAETE